MYGRGTVGGFEPVICRDALSNEKIGRSREYVRKAVQ